MTQTTPPLPDESRLPTLRALLEATNAMQRVGNRHIERLGLTPAQFDVLATLGDTEGMPCRDLGECTLITKGTLTGVLDRLEAKGYVRRTRSALDSRQIIVSLTMAGQAEYERTFEPHVRFMRQYFDRLPADRQETLQGLLQDIKTLFRSDED